MTHMEDSAFDSALVASAFSLAGERGWRHVSVSAAAREAGLPLDRARGRFLGRAGILGRFGRLADQHALAQATTEGTHRDRLFDLLMRRVDFLQTHRAGVLALKTYLPAEPGLTLMLGAATLASMAWMLEGAGISAQGLRGGLRARGLVAVWMCALRAWERDHSEDLSATMAALDKALNRAERAESWLSGGGRRAAPVPTEEASAAAAGSEIAGEADDGDAVPPVAPPPDGNEPPLPGTPEPPISPAS